MDPGSLVSVVVTVAIAAIVLAGIAVLALTPST